MRYRIIEWNTDRKGKVTTNVLSEEEETYRGGTSITSTFRCKSCYFFVEVCVMKAYKTALCSTSRLKWFPSAVVPEPGVKWRPLVFLDLSPSDSAVLKTVTVPQTEENITSLFEDKPMTFFIRGVFEPNKGKKRCTPWTRNWPVSARIPPRKGSVTTKDNGSLVYVAYTTKSCRSSTNNWNGNWDTKVLVSKKHASLVKQDFPTFEQREYPPTRFNEPAEKDWGRNAGGQKVGGATLTAVFRDFWCQRLVTPCALSSTD